MVIAMSDPFADMHNAAFGILADAAQYTESPGSDPVSVGVVVDRNLARWADTINVTGASAVVTIPASTISTTPPRGARLDMDTGDAWLVERCEIDDGHAYVCRVVDA